MRCLNDLWSSNKVMCVTILLSLSIVCGCGDTYLDKMWKSNVEHESSISFNSERIAQLQAQCDTINKNIESLRLLVRAIQENDYVIGVEMIENGYRVRFRKGGFVDVFNGADGKDGVDGKDGADGKDGENGKDGAPGKDGENGKDGAPGKDGEDGKDGECGKDGQDGKDAAAPFLSMKQGESGVWYWMLDGKFIEDKDGNRIPVYGDNANVPQVRIDNGRWQISYDSGNTWKDAGPADGQNGDMIFGSIDINTADVIFKLSDGTSFTLPRWNGIEISLDIEGDETGVEPRKEIQINYHLNYSSDETIVTAASDGNYRVNVQKKDNVSGRITITSPKYYEDGHVSIMASDGSGYFAIKVVNFYKRELFITGDAYTIPPQGGSITIPVAANFEYVLKYKEDVQWLRYTSTPAAAVRKQKIDLIAEMNKSFEDRSAVLELYAKNDPSHPLKEMNITQTAAIWRLGRNRYMLNAAACELSTYAESTSGLVVSCDESWLNVITETEDNIHYSIKVSVKDNDTGVMRSASVVFKTADGEDELGIMSVSQVALGEENPDDMIVKVRLNSVNSYKSVLPICGQVDCFIDWGDGSEVEHVVADYPSHQYEESVKDYVVHISGTASALNSSVRYSPSVSEVVQWGNLGIKNMQGAFENDYLLVKIAGDISGAFSGVDNFNDAFRGCAFLESIPKDLFASAINATSFRSTFYKCVSLRSIPEELFKNCGMANDMTEIFADTEIIEIPEGLLVNCSRLKNVDAMFRHCKSIKSIPQKLFWNCPKICGVNDLFRDCASLENIPEKFFMANSDIESMVTTFSGCSSLKSLPADLFSYLPNLKWFWQTFCVCSALETIPVSIFDNNRKIQDTQEMFFCCGLTGESPYTVIEGKKVHLYERWMYPDWFYPISKTYNRAFTGNNFVDQDSMPENWRY